MKMKKLLYIFIALSLGLASCSDVIEAPETLPADCIMLNVYNSPMTKAQNWAGLEYERQLLRLDCFFYPKGQTNAPCVYYQKVDVDKVGSAEIPFYVDESVINTIFPSSDQCDVFVIANLTSGTFAKGQTGTDVPTLSKTVLTLGADRDAIDMPFVMQGLDIATKGDNNNASGTIPLHRVAAKITVTVNIPEQIVIEYENADDIIMVPVLKDNENAIPFKTAFHNGVKKTYLRADYSSQIVAADVHHVGKQDYVAAGEVPAVGDTPKKYTFTCEIPFYTYARAWEKGAEDAAYLTFEMPWTNVSDPENPVTQTYYYQILVNGGGRCFEPNNWYDLTVNVGVIGSTVESEPVTIQDLTYYVLDWTTEPDPEHEAGGDRYEDVNITDYTYLIVPEPRLVINNASTGVIHFDASHKVDIKMNTASKPVEILPGKNTTSEAFYVDCGKTPPSVTSLAINTGNFTIDHSSGTLTYNYTIPAKVFSPVYVYATIWLELDGESGMSTAEEEFSEDITIVQYPPLYIVPEESVEKSVYVNGNRATASSHDVIYVNDKTYDLGGAPGTGTKYMHTITVSSFTENNTFELHGQKVSYIIGDPRVRVSDINLNDDGYDMDENKAWAEDEAGRRLQYYYPTSTEGEVYRVIAPKFRVSSKLGGYSEGDREGVMMRCASYQENGYPAGRWRVPTTAEIAFIVYLQSQDAIAELFVSNDYFSSTHMVTEGNNKEVIKDIDGDKHSVRCVYDEWYWGGEQEALVNTAKQPTAGDYYYYTWGDKKIW